MIKNFSVIETFARFATAVSARANRMTFFNPVNDVEIMNVLLDDVIAANPGEVIPIAHLIFHFGELASVLFFQIGARMDPGSVAIPISAHRNDVANFAVVNAFERFDVTGLMMTLQT